MNQEATFALRFMIKDFAKMRKAIDEINRKMKTTNDTAKTLDKSFSRATMAVGKFALGFFALSKIINGVFRKANEQIQLDVMAQSAGVARSEIAKLGKALRIYGGDAKSAGSAYASLTNIIGGATHGMGISEDVARVNAMYGIGFNYGNISQDTLMTEIAKTMHRLRGQKDQWAINQIASAYGIDAPMANFLAEKGANWKAFVNTKEYKDLSKSELQRLLDEEEQFNLIVDKALIEIVHGVNYIVDYIKRELDKSRQNDINRQEQKFNELKTFPNVSLQQKREYARQQMLAGKLDYGKYVDLLHTWDEQEKAEKEKEPYRDMFEAGKIMSDINDGFGLRNLLANIIPGGSFTIRIIGDTGAKFRTEATEKAQNVNIVTQPSSVRGG